jgi:hypothetical protein
MNPKTAQKVAQALIAVPGIEAVALGGSNCTGTASEKSDVDLGVYYTGGFDTGRMDDVLKELDDAGRSGLLNKPGEWGKWINGGAWLTVDGVKTDILLRETGRVSQVIYDCQQGKITVDFQAGHPFGFVNAIYMGEVKYCIPLCDPQGALERLKELAQTPSQAYRGAASKWFLWEAGFSFQTGRSSIAKQDVVYASGCLFKGIMCLAQALFAANGEILLNEKGALRRLGRFDFCPPGFIQVAERALEGLRKDGLASCFDAMEEQYREVSRLFGNGEA